MKTSPGDQLDDRALAWLIGGLALAALPHATQVPWWVSALFAMAATWRVAVARGLLTFPNRWLLGAITLGSALAVIAHYGMFIGPDSGTALLVAMAGLKLLETRSRRDSHLAAILGFLVIVSWFFHSQNLGTGFYMILAMVVLVTAMVTASQIDGSRPWWKPLSTAATLIMQALPFTLILFLLMPRLQFPLWHLPERGGAGVTGISDTMSPGTISHLAQSSKVAFRVRFAGPVPARKDLYWRGPVLNAFDGRTWTRNNAPGRSIPTLIPDGAPIGYTTILEPHGGRYLFALDLPKQPPLRARLTSSYELLWDAPVDGTLSYSLRSFPSYTLAPGATPSERPTRALYFPDDSNPRTRELGRQLRSELPSHRERVQRVLTLFRQEAFTYTLQPPLLSGDVADQFLFDSRRGFCEHFASSFVLLMRAAGVPARVVTGYQGGEVNPLDEYLIIRQSDAHAWAEVWLAGEGWTRVDPTAAVSPERIEVGLSAALAAEPGGLFAVQGELGLIRHARLGWDALNNRWNEWIVGYGAGAQRDLLVALGVASFGYLGSIATMVALLPAAGFLVWLASRLRSGGRKPVDPVTRSYTVFCRRLARLGISRGRCEGPLAFAERAASTRPDLANEIRKITEAYTTMKFAEERTDARLTELRRAVRAFRPGPPDDGLLGR